MTLSDSMIQELRPCPWPVIRSQNETLLLAKKAPASTPFIKPELYGLSELPQADSPYTDMHVSRRIRVISVPNVWALQTNCLVEQSTSSVLPQSFFRGKRRRHGGIIRDEEGLFRMRRPLDMADAQRIDVPVFYAETDQPDCFGHVLLEAIPRLWAYNELNLDVQVVGSTSPNRSYRKLFEAAGCDPSKYVKLSKPTLCSELIIADPPLERRTHIHPAAWDVFERVKRLRFESGITPPERIFISRSKIPKRRLTNELEVEEIFANNDFTIVHPQDWPIEDQINLFSSAKMIAGLGGSAMHNALFAGAGAKILIVCSSRWLVKADMLLNQTPARLGYVLGHPHTIDPKKYRQQGDWSVNVADVRLAIKEHFSLDS